MADKKINELPVSSGLTDDALLPVYQNDQTQSITGALVKSFAVRAAQGYADTAQQAAQAAETSAQKAVESVGQLGDEVEQAQNARAGAEAARTAIENMKVAASTLSDGQSATVEKTTEDDVVKLTFGLPRGPSGTVGKSAYQAAVEKGYTGTEEEFNAALAGMKDGPFFPAKGGDVGAVNITGSLTTDGDIEVDFKGCRVQGVNAPNSGTDAANKEYVDDAISTAISGAIAGAY